MQANFTHAGEDYLQIKKQIPPPWIMFQNPNTLLSNTWSLHSNPNIDKAPSFLRCTPKLKTSSCHSQRKKEAFTKDCLRCKLIAVQVSAMLVPIYRREIGFPLGTCWLRQESDHCSKVVVLTGIWNLLQLRQTIFLETEAVYKTFPTSVMCRYLR